MISITYILKINATNMKNMVGKIHKNLNYFLSIVFIFIIGFPSFCYTKESLSSSINARSQQDEVEIKAHFSLARDFQTRGKLREAEQELKKVLSLEPKYFQALLQLGMLYKRQKRYRDAVIEFKKALFIQPSVIAHKNLGITYLKLGDHFKAVKEFEAVIKINTNVENVHFLLAKALFKNKTGSRQRVIKEFKEALKTNPQFWEANFGLGLAYKSIHLYKEAIPQFEEVVALKPDYADAFYQLGHVYSGVKEGKAAIKNFLKAEELYKKSKNMQKLKKTQKVLNKLFKKYDLDRSDFS